MTPERIMPENQEGPSQDNPANAELGTPAGSPTPEVPTTPPSEEGMQAPRRSPFRRRMSPPARDVTPPEPTSPRGELSDEELDLQRIAREAGIEFPIVENEDWEYLQKAQRNIQVIGSSASTDEIIEAANELHMPADELKEMLERRGRGQDILDAVEARRGELPLGEPEADMEDIFEIFRPHIEGLPEEEKAGFEESINIIRDQEKDAEEVIGALNKMKIFPPNIPDEAIEKLLEGHDQAKIDEIKGRKDEWTVSEEYLAEEPELPDEERADLPDALAEGEGIIGDAQSGIPIANGATTPEEVARAEKIEEGVRGRIGSWLDRNPGKMQKANRLLVRPGIALLLITAVIYLSLLNIATKGATQRVGK